MTTKTATLVKSNLPGFSGTAHLYKLDPPVGVHEWKNYAHEYDECDASGSCTAAEHVIVSAVTLPIPPMYPGMPITETYVFPATPDGQIADWGELNGSYKGGLDHGKALGNAGYEVTA